MVPVMYHLQSLHPTTDAHPWSVLHEANAMRGVYRLVINYLVEFFLSIVFMALPQNSVVF